MELHARRLIVRTCFMLFFSAWTASPARAELDAEVLRTLRANADQMRTVTAEWVSRDEPLQPVEALTKISPVFANRGFWEPVTIKYAFDRGHYHSYARTFSAKADRQGRFGDELFELETQVTFDGKVQEYGDPKKQMDRRLVEEWKKTAPTARILQTNYWDAAGWVVADAMNEHGIESVTPLVLYLSESGVPVEELAGEEVSGQLCRRLKVLANGNQYDVWLDPAVGLSPRRWTVRTMNGVLIRDSAAEGHKPLQGAESVWLPEICTVEYHQLMGVIPAEPNQIGLLRRRFELKAVELGQRLPDAELRVKSVAGANVRDSTIPETKGTPINYIVPARPEDLDSAVQQALKGSHFDRENARSNWLFYAANAAAIIALGVVVWLRRRRKN